jgi:hypothetical protein
MCLSARSCSAKDAVAIVNKESHLKTSVLTSDRLSTLLLDCFNPHRGFDAWYQALSDAFTASYPGARTNLNEDQARAFNEVFTPAFSDVHFEFSGSATQGDTTRTRWDRYRHTRWTPRSRAGKVVPPTGKKVRLSRDHRCAGEERQDHARRDLLNLAEFLGALGLT